MSDEEIYELKYGDRIKIILEVTGSLVRFEAIKGNYDENWDRLLAEGVTELEDATMVLCNVLTRLSMSDGGKENEK